MSHSRVITLLCTSCTELLAACVANHADHIGQRAATVVPVADEVAVVREVNKSAYAAVIEPACFGTHAGHADLATGLSAALKLRRLRRVVVIARPSVHDLRVVHHVSALVPATLLVKGVDGQPELAAALGWSPVVSGADGRASDYEAGILRLSPSLKEAVVTALRKPGGASVKLLAVNARMSIRTVQRHFRLAGLPRPEAFIRAIKLEALRSALSRADVTRDELATAGGWRDQRALQRALEELTNDGQR